MTGSVRQVLACQDGLDVGTFGDGVRDLRRGHQRLLGRAEAAEPALVDLSIVEIHRFSNRSRSIFDLPSLPAQEAQLILQTLHSFMSCKSI
jgi:hypothetical protein